ncbi:MAG: hypothetical protein NTY90_00975 [Candidatus Micrarchaeota archaeon]|nr:hypothetical protein [Candidatus Micrarchaeota archaeon]
MAWRLRPPLCMVCSSGFEKNGDKIVLCGQREGVVHGECCKKKCSLDGQGHVGCPHARGVFEKKDLVVK